jgi:Tol biopolymer transport system component
VASNGAQANGGSGVPAISADGRHVTYQSDAPNLVVGDSNVASDVFVFDRQTATTTRASVGPYGGSPSTNIIDGPSISSDGRYVVFRDGRTRSGSASIDSSIFVFDRQAATTALVSSAGPLAQAPVISGNGRHIVWETFLRGSPGLDAITDVVSWDRLG